MASIFTRIVNGEIPSAKVYEDELTLAFMDIRPISKGHTLVISKAEHPTLLDLPPEVVTATALATQKVARAVMAAVGASGFNIIQNNGAASGQEVFHYHVHIIPRWDGDGAIKFLRPDSNATDLQVLAAQIAEQLS